METTTKNSQPAPVTDQTSQPAKNHKKKKHQNSALYAASLLHSAVNHVKAPNAGHSRLPVQL
jgi:hypothetical protein